MPRLEVKSRCRGFRNLSLLVEVQIKIVRNKQNSLNTTVFRSKRRKCTAISRLPFVYILGCKNWFGNGYASLYIKLQSQLYSFEFQICRLGNGHFFLLLSEIKSLKITINFRFFTISSFAISSQIFKSWCLFIQSYGTFKHAQNTGIFNSCF